MRDYSKIKSAFWTGRSGKLIRAIQDDFLRMSLWAVRTYLLTNRHANMLGLYELPLIFVSHEVGLTIQQVELAIAELEKMGFCRYDRTSEFVWVFNMARSQVLGDSEGLKDNDKRVKAIQKLYDELPDNLFLSDFHDIYSAAFHLQGKRSSGVSLPIKKPTPKKESEKPETSKPVLLIPLLTKVNGKQQFHGVTESDLANYAKAFPAVPIKQELEKCRQWNLDNPKRRKTSAVIRKHIFAWLANEQDKGGQSVQAEKPMPPVTETGEPDFLRMGENQLSPWIEQLQVNVSGAKSLKEMQVKVKAAYEDQQKKIH